MLGERFESTNSCARNPAADLSTYIFASRRKPAMGGNFEFAASNSTSDFQNVVPFLPTICPTRSSDLASPKSQRPQSNANDHLRQGRTTTSWTLIVDLLRRRPNSIETRVNGTGVEWYLW